MSNGGDAGHVGVRREDKPAHALPSPAAAPENDGFLHALRAVGLSGPAVVGGRARDKLLGARARSDIDVQLQTALSRTEQAQIDWVCRRGRTHPLTYTLTMRLLRRRIHRRQRDGWHPLIRNGILDHGEGLATGAARYQGTRVHIAKHVLLTEDGQFIPERRGPTFELVAMSPQEDIIAFDPDVAADLQFRRIRVSGQGILTIRSIMRAVSLKHQFEDSAYDEESWREMTDFGRRLKQGGPFAHWNLYSRHARKINLARLGETLQRAGAQWEPAIEDLRRLGILALIESASPRAGELIRYRGTQDPADPDTAVYKALLSRYPRKDFPLDAAPTP